MSGEGREQGNRALLADVARLSGVSEITVSRVMRNKGPIAAATRERVLRAVAETGYVPNRLAGALASSGSALVGVVLPSVSNIVFADVLRGIHAALAPSGHQPVVGVTDYDRDEEERVVRSLLAWQPAAMILAGFEHTAATRAMLTAGRLRVAEIMDIDTAPIDVAVGLSHRRAGRDIARHLIGRGYRRFAYVGHDWDRDHRARLRYDGLVGTLAEGGLALVGERRIAGPSSTLAGREMLAALMESGARPDVVVFSNDDMAVGGYFHCLAAGLAPRRDIALFGFNGLDIAAALPLRLSTVRTNRMLIGERAAAALVGSAERPDAREIIDTGYVLEAGETA